MDLGLITALAGGILYLSNKKSPPRETFSTDAPVVPHDVKQDTQGQHVVVPSNVKRVPKHNTIRTLAGETIQSSDFTHNNQVPFFRGSVKQNINDSMSNRQLELHTGYDQLSIPKKEQKPFFSNYQKDFGNVHGTQNKTDFMQSRMVNSRIKNNEKPFEQERVGPGLNQGYTTAPSGGYQQSNTLDYAKPRGVDELRVLSNPKMQYEGRTIQGRSKVVNRGLLGETKKYLPERFYENKDGERNLRSKASYSKPTVRSTIEPSSRPELSQEYIPGGGPTGQQGESYVDGEYHAPHKRQHGSFNMGAKNQVHEGSTDMLGSAVNSYGKHAYEVLPNERTMTESRTYLSGFKSVVQELTAPMLDSLRDTKKQLVIGNHRQAGNLQGQVPRHTVKDENDIARTTIKETTLHSQTGNAGHVAFEQGYVYDPNHIAKTTIKETTHTDYYGLTNQNTSGGEGYLAAHENTNLRLTQKHTLHNETIGNTNTNLSGAGGGAYETTGNQIRPTQKEDIAAVEYGGVAGSTDNKAPMVYDTAYEARLNEAKQIISMGREPKGSGKKVFQNEVGEVKQGVEIENTYVGGKVMQNYQVGGSETMGTMQTRAEPSSEVMEDRLRDFNQLKDNPFALSVKEM